MESYERIARAITLSGKKKKQIAEECGVSPSAVTQWLTGESKSLRPESIFALAKATGFSARWLALGDGPERTDEPAAGSSEEQRSPSEDDYALIPQYTAKGSSGNGYLNDHVEIKGGLAFKRDWLCRMGLKPDNLRVAYNHGDSNWPTLTDGEVVLLDVAAVEPANGKMFALLDPDGEVIFKRLIRDITGGWLIRSDNDNKTRYPDMPISDEGIRGVEIIGRIVWRGGAM